MPAATGIAVSASAVSGRTTGATLHSRATVGRTTAAHIDANANHRSWSRSTPVDRRRRWTSGTIATTSEPRNSGMPTPTSSGDRRAVDGIGVAAADEQVADARGPWPSRAGRSATPMMLTHATACQPRRVQVPVGEPQEGQDPERTGGDPARQRDPLAERPARPSLLGGPQPPALRHVPGEAVNSAVGEEQPADAVARVARHDQGAGTGERHRVDRVEHRCPRRAPSPTTARPRRPRSPASPRAATPATTQTQALHRVDCPSRPRGPAIVLARNDSQCWRVLQVPHQRR